jgi:IS605 OrfB family transposase
MENIRTISCKLQVAPYQVAHLKATMKAFADACNFVADYGRKNKVSRQFVLHKACYAEIRMRFKLSANLAIRAIARAAPRLAKAKTRNSAFKPTSIDYDARIFSFREGDRTVSLTLLNSRERFGLDIGEWQKKALKGQTPTSATLCKKGKDYSINIQVKEPIPTPDQPAGTLGVDLGIKSIATLSDGISFGGATLNAYRLKRHKVRKSLQSKAHKGSPCTRKNARRTLKRLSGRERRYQKWINHNISKQVVETAKVSRQAIVLEDLKGIRDLTNPRLRRSQRGLHNAWAFYQLAEFIRYKAAHAGVVVVSVDPRYTSQTCSSCRHLGRRRGKVFSCSNCGVVLDADLNGALNIAAVGAVVTRPENSTPFAATRAAAVG